MPVPPAIDRLALQLPPRQPRPAGGAEAGSAYIVALLVLVVMTIVGLALTLVTQTEVRIGANERTANRSFYAADSGLNVAVAANLPVPNPLPTVFKVNTTLQDTGSSPAATFSDQVTAQPLYAMSMSPSNLSQINQNSQMNIRAITSMDSSTANRLGADGSVSATFSGRTTTAHIFMDPRNADQAIIYDKPQLDTSGILKPIPH
ncbi:MAG TPA: pilus assembly PilX N-terminal domain-containing protein [Thermoanaerobaculia bacterium]|nr:pilus assembly PilX N-terminal domain-containing protein [Thermoanaerobaculia bacterium]